jgi:hypothetical protein
MGGMQTVPAKNWKIARPSPEIPRIGRICKMREQRRLDHP